MIEAQVLPIATKDMSKSTPASIPQALFSPNRIAVTNMQANGEKKVNEKSKSASICVML